MAAISVKVYPMVFLVVFLLLALILAFSVGSVPLSVFSVFSGSATDVERIIFAEIRAPRVVLAAIVGASLASSGAALQGVFRNPLGDPGLIGVSGGAALGAATAIFLGSAFNFSGWPVLYSIPLAAIIGATLVTFFLYKFTSYLGHFSIITVLLVGIAINAFSTVGIMGFQYLSDDAQLRSLVFWLMGSFARAEWETVIPAACIILSAVIMLYRQTRALDRLQLGESQAFHLGVDVKKLQRFIILSAAVSVGVGVALSGIIGFVGLVVPHLIRLTLGVTHRILVPASAILGAALMISADLTSRTLIAPIELPVGIVTSAIGAPFFLWLIARAKH
jgi:iron complex transport system permease protein